MSLPLRILMPSIVHGDVRRGGAWTVTRGLLELLGRLRGGAEVVTVVPPEPVWHRLRQAACVAAAPLTRVPAKVSFLRSRPFRRRLRRLVAQERFDLMVVNGSDLLWCVDDAPPDTVTIAMVHNREANLYRDQVRALTPRVGPLQRLLLADAARLQRFETDGLRRVHGAIFLSTVDAADLAARIPGLDHLVLPPVFVDAPERIAKARRDSGLDIGYLANFAWWPNHDGLQWMVREVLPHVPADVRLHLFGHASMDVADEHPRIVVHGFADDLREVWRTCDWMVVPTRFGSGVSIKTAESLYHGMPVLSTRFGLRGLQVKDHSQVVIRDTAQDWISFLNSPESRALCRERLPTDVSDRFSLHAHRDDFDRFVSRLLSSVTQ